MIQMFVQYDAAHDTVEELGALGVVQFSDVSSALCSRSLPGQPQWSSSCASEVPRGAREVVGRASLFFSPFSGSPLLTRPCPR